jgi:hypothetical protein
MSANPVLGRGSVEHGHSTALPATTPLAALAVLIARLALLRS